MINYYKIKLQPKQINLIMHQVYFKCIGNAIKNSEYILVDLKQHLTFLYWYRFYTMFSKFNVHRKLK